MRILLSLVLVFASAACSPNDGRISIVARSSWEVVEQQYVDDLSSEIDLLETVFWEPEDTISLRRLIRETALVKDKTVLEIGTGSGLLSLCALRYGAAKVVATDVNPAAVANARHNAIELGLAERLEVRLVPLDDTAAYAVIEDGEKFDLILSNPPWVDRTPPEIAAFAHYDEGFQLMRTMLAGLEQHLNPGGRTLLAYGSVSGIRMLKTMSSERNMGLRIVDDDRNLDDLPEEFLPGMLLEVDIYPNGTFDDEEMEDGS